MNSPEEPGAYRGPVRRVRIAVAGDTWRIVGQVRVDRMTIPTRPRPGRRITDSASFVEVTDADDQVVHWQPIEDPSDTSVEVFEPGGRIHREPGDLENVVEVIVPDDRPLGRLRLVARGTEVRAAHRDAPGGVPLDDPEAPETGG